MGGIVAAGVRRRRAGRDVPGRSGKILVIVVQLWLVLTMYRDIVLAAFFAAFVVTVLVFSMALFVRD